MCVLRMCVVIDLLLYIVLGSVFSGISLSSRYSLYLSFTAAFIAFMMMLVSILMDGCEQHTLPSLYCIYAMHIIHPHHATYTGCVCQQVNLLSVFVRCVVTSYIKTLGCWQCR